MMQQMKIIFQENFRVFTGWYQWFFKKSIRDIPPKPYIPTDSGEREYLENKQGMKAMWKGL